LGKKGAGPTKKKRFRREKTKSKGKVWKTVERGGKVHLGNGVYKPRGSEETIGSRNKKKTKQRVGQKNVEKHRGENYQSTYFRQPNFTTGGCRKDGGGGN